jgi:endo-1,4-beta-xylanase
VYRIINSCCTWGENVSYHQPPQHSPLEYLQTCLQAGIEFEAIGLQLYYPDRDLFEIDRQLERFSQLGKPIHITELGVSSATTIDELSYLKEPIGRWRSVWSEAIQGDWVEQFYTLCYSKSYIKAISWWDLTDNGNFWPHGGLVNQYLTPKLAYERLKNLIQTWRGQA